MDEKRRPLAVVENHVEVAASPEILWTCFADISKWPHWFPALVEVEWLSEHAWILGAQFRQVVKFGFPLGKVTGLGTIVEISPSPYVAWEGKVMGIDAIHGYRFDATKEGTRVLSRHEYYGAPALMARLFFLTRRVHRIYQTALEGFKAYIETGTIQLKMPV